MKLTSLLVLALLVWVEGRNVNEIMKADHSTFYTTRDHGYSDFQMVMLEDTDSIFFRMRACSDGHVGLSDFSGVMSEVVLGGWWGSRSALRRGLYGEEYTSAATPQLLHCAEYRTFWISWRNERLEVGQGPTVGYQTLMGIAKSVYNHDINRVMFSTGYGHTGQWQVEENQGYYLIVTTPDNFQYSYIWKSVNQRYNFFPFKVKCCHDVHLNLSPHFGKRVTEVVLGGWNNTRSVIRKNGGSEQEKVSYMETGIVGCDRTVSFWISWQEGNIKVGKGELLDQKTIMEWKDDAFVGITHISAATGYGSTGVFIFEEDLENKYTYFTTSSNKTWATYDVFALTPMQDYLQFRLQACSDGWVAISSAKGYVDDFSQFIGIGLDQNQNIKVFDGYNVDPVIQTTSPDILLCNYTRPFWISWAGGQARFGHGSLVGSGQLLVWDLPISYPFGVQSVGLSNTHESGAYFTLKKNAADGHHYDTQSNFAYQNAWLSVKEDFFVTFRVRACKEVTVILAGIQGVTDREVYVVIIGYQSDKTVIAEKVGGENILLQADTPEVVSCTVHRAFWISWLNGYVAVGQGHKYNQRYLLAMAETKPHPVNAISISTKDSRGHWEFDGDAGDVVVARSLDMEVQNKWVHFRSWVKWTYFQVLGGGARLHLSPRYQQSGQGYSFFIGINQNTQVALFKDGSQVVSITRPGILDGVQTTDMWVSWENGVIALGLTKHRGVEPLIEWRDSGAYDIKAMGLSAASGASAEWKIWDDSLVEMTYDTRNVEEFQQLSLSVRHRSSTTFGLKSCGGASILLSTVMFGQEDKFSFMVTMQDANNKTTIWLGVRYQNLVEQNTPDLLSCNEERFFWLSWYKGGISLGRGKVISKSSVITYQGLKVVPVHALAVASNLNTATWRFPMTDDDFRDISGPAGLSGGAIFGVVVGFLALFALFLGALYVMYRPPERLQSFLRTGGVINPSAQQGGFSNPLANGQ